MTLYPQLSTGTTCQYPIVKTLAYRTIVNSLEDGSRITLPDPNATSVRWNLTYTGITDVELGELRSFFELMEGRLNLFAFLDPTANLLVWSEILTNAAWQTSTLLSLEANFGDPVGTERATRVTNSTQGSLSLLQTVSLPSSLICCLSVYVRSDSGATITLSHDGTTVQHQVTGSWNRIALTSAGSGSEDSSNFSITVPTGSAVDLFGLQVVAQTTPSTYTLTLNVSGVYPETRFDSDALMSTADALNSNTCQISLYSRTS